MENRREREAWEAWEAFTASTKAAQFERQGLLQWKPDVPGTIITIGEDGEPVEEEVGPRVGCYVGCALSGDVIGKAVAGGFDPERLPRECWDMMERHNAHEDGGRLVMHWFFSFYWLEAELISDIITAAWDNLPHAATTTPQGNSWSNTLVTRDLPALCKDGMKRFPMGKGGNGLELCMMVSDRRSAERAKRLTTWDVCVLLAAESLSEAGYTEFTEQTIYEKLAPGKDVRISASMRDRIAASLLDLRDIRIWCRTDRSRDFIETWDKGRLRRDDVFWSLAKEQPIIDVNREVCVYNGNVCPVWKFEREPPTHVLGHCLGQVMTPSDELLEAAPGERVSWESITVRHMLAQRVERLNHSKDKTENIRYQGIIEALGKDYENRLHRSRVAEVVRSVLDEYKRRGLIASWSEYTDPKNRRRAGGVTVAKAAKRLTV